MKPNRRQKTLSILESIERQEADDVSRRLALEQRQMEAFRSVSVRREADLESALDDARKRLQPGSTLNLALLGNARLSITLQSQLCASAQTDLDAATHTVDTARNELEQHHRRLERFSELADEEQLRVVTERSKSEDKDIDELWLGVTREGIQQ